MDALPALPPSVPASGIAPTAPQAGAHRQYCDSVEREDEDQDLVSTLIPYKNPRALAAYYCGFFALLPAIGLLFGVLAIVLGIQGLRYAKAQPKTRGGGHALTGIILGVVACFFWNPVVCFLLYVAYVY